MHAFMVFLSALVTVFPHDAAGASCDLHTGSKAHACLGDAHVSMQIVPARKTAGPGYNGVRVKVSVSGAKNDCMMIFSGRRNSVRMSLKKKWGILWTSGPVITIENVPAVYMEAWTDANVMKRHLDDRVFRDARKTCRGSISAGVMAGEEERKTILDEFGKSRRSKGLESIRPGGIVEAGSQKIWQAGFFIPACAGVGVYDVTVYYNLDSPAGLKKMQSTFTVKHSASVALVVNLAEKHGLLYGIIATIAALALGLGAGALSAAGMKKR